MLVSWQLRTHGRSNPDCRACTYHSMCNKLLSPCLLLSSTGGQLLLHDFKTGSKLMALSSDAIPKRSLTFCPADGQLLAAAADDGSVCVWDVRTRLPLHELQKQHKVSQQVDLCQLLHASGRPAYQHRSCLQRKEDKHHSASTSAETLTVC